MTKRIVLAEKTQRECAERCDEVYGLHSLASLRAHNKLAVIVSNIRFRYAEAQYIFQGVIQKCEKESETDDSGQGLSLPLPLSYMYVQ